MDDLGTVGKNLPRILPPPKKNWNFPWRTWGLRVKTCQQHPPPQKAGTSHGRPCAEYNILWITIVYVFELHEY